jgi:DMSO/TMAO reductase YedYZ molybdopterin-dependent catalytic subunit
VGARFADFAAAYRPATGSGEPPGAQSKPDELVRYVSLETPGRGYYVGLDRESALHPQMLLVYEMDGQPLALAHGAPLRLFAPVKYGIQSLKRIETIRFTDERPADFWAARGYDWYSGH